MNTTKRLLVASFTDDHDVLEATKSAKNHGYKIVDVYTPFAVHGLDDAMGLRPSRFAWLTFGLGITGAMAKLWYQIWISATSWPVNVGGKPLVSLPAFVPVTFEVMVLFAGVGSVLGFLLYRKLWPGKKPAVLYDRVTNDRFVIVLEQTDAAFSVAAVRSLFEAHHVLHLEEIVTENEMR